jgi:hypothetical protein
MTRDLAAASSLAFRETFSMYPSQRRAQSSRGDSSDYLARLPRLDPELARLFTRVIVRPILATLALATTIAVAEVEDVKPPAGIGPLPDFDKKAAAGVAVTAPYTEKYRAVLPPEVAELLARGELAFEAALRPKRSIDLPKEWSLASGKSEELQSNGAIPASFTPSEGFPFSSPSVNEATRDPQRAGAALLWNAASIPWSARSLEVTGKLRAFREARSAPRELTFDIMRIYPRSFGVSPGKLLPLFRERIGFGQPEILRGLKWLSFRFLGEEEDYMWAASPTTRTVRQMTGSNRSDRIFARGFAPNDLFVWSGKIESLSIKGVHRQPLLVPVIEAPLERQQTEEKGCAKWQSGKGSELLLGQESRRVPQAPNWVPSNSLWVLRHVWRVDVTNRDPFLLDARQSIYLDATTMSPVYTVSWDQAGALRKIVIGILGVAGQAGSELPVWRGQIVFTAGEPGASLTEVQSVARCESLRTGSGISDFDPKALMAQLGVPKVAPAAGKEGVKASKPVPLPKSEPVKDIEVVSEVEGT